MANVTNSFILNFLSTEDSTQNVMVNRGINVSFDETVGEFVAYESVNGTNTLFMPKTVCYQVYVRNLSAGTLITVTISPVGGPPGVLVCELTPGGKDFLLYCSSPGGGTGGFTSVAVSSAAPAEYEFFIGG